MLDFVRRRLRRLIALDPSLAAPSRLDESTAAATPAMVTRLGSEIPQVQTARTTIWRARAKDAGEGDASSGLRPDVIE